MSTDFYCPTLPEKIIVSIMPNKRNGKHPWWKFWKKHRKERDYFMVERPFLVILSNHDILIVPKGFTTDLASIPDWARSIIHVMDSHMPAAVVHDYLYRSKDGKERGRKFADKLFLRIMKEMGVKKWKRDVMYTAVRRHGKGSYQKEGKIGN
jgi:hypothetical protein